MNIIIDVTYFICGIIYTNFRTFLCKKCDVGYCVISHGVYRRRSCHPLVFIVSILLLCKILNACQNYAETDGIVAYTLINVREKIQFLSSIKKMYTNEIWFIFFWLAVYMAWDTAVGAAIYMSDVD